MKILISILFALLLFPASVFAQTYSLSWQAPAVDATHDPATSYLVQRKTGSTAFVTIATVPTTNYVDTIANDPGGVTYTWQIIASNANGLGAASGQVSATTPAQPPPAGSSPNNTRVPPSAQIVDAQGAVWTLGPSAGGNNKYVLKNGQFAGGTNGTIIAWCNAVVYHYDPGSGFWYGLNSNGTSWFNAGKTIPCP